MKFTKIIDYIKLKMPKSKGTFLVILGIIGMLLILLASFDYGGKVSTQNNAVETDAPVKDYSVVLEEKIEGLISDMLGGTEVTAMVTLESSVEYVYADEVKTDADVTRDQTALKTQQSDSNHKTYVVIKDSQGNEHPVVITEKMPEIRGVVVVCVGGEKSNVASAVRLAVRSALDLAEDKICVMGRH
ncbi:MAG: hypothetical protein J6S13_08660 [Clostridia bacterium]|nr:hypothetical protein [Clostridia bacterium]